MAKRSSDARHSKWVESGLQKVVQLDVDPQNFPAGCELVLLRDVTLTIIGPVTQNTYRFVGAGSTAWVDEQDVPALLARRGGRSCCSGMNPLYFERVGG